MAEPIFDTTTERIWKTLPEFYRIEDEHQGWPFKKWLSGIFSQLYPIEAMIDRIRYTPPEDGVVGDTSDLTDPLTADAAWLPWLSQFVGVVLPNNMSVSDRRNAIHDALRDPQPGTKAAMAKAAQTVLSGSKTVSVYDHSTAGNINTAGEWDMLVVTLGPETTSDPALAIIALGQKPAGVLLHSTTFSANWNSVEAGLPTWNNWEGKTWTQVENTGL